VRQEVKGFKTVLEWLKIRRVTSCKQLLKVLEGMPVGPNPVLIFDFLKPFYEDEIGFEEKKMMPKLRAEGF
jgi:hypothetical protein